MNSLKRNKSYFYPLLLLMAMVIGLLGGESNHSNASRTDILRKYSHTPSKNVVNLEHHLILDDNQEETDECHASSSACILTSEALNQSLPLVHSFTKTSLLCSSVLTSQTKLFLLFCTYLI
jgi:hypothetical protein